MKIDQKDIVIVGGGTAGVYFGWLMAKKGFSVIIIEKDSREKVAERLDVIHFETDRIEKHNIPPPKEGSEELIGVFEEDTVNGPDFETKVKVKAYQTVLRLPYFLRRMYGVIQEDGVEILFSCKFQDLIFEDKKIVGIKVIKDNDEIEIKTKLVVDASGTTAAIRTSLTRDYGVETFSLGPQDVMYVLLQYIKWKYPDTPHPSVLNSYIYYLAWLGPCQYEDGAILGVGQPGSYKNAEKVRNEFLKDANLPPYEIIKEEQGFTPYRRPPYSLVSDGFLCIGDAAAITYPFSGHGVTATWNLCKIAADRIGEILKENIYLTRELLWNINVDYFRDQGAKFAMLFTQLSGILNFTKKEWNYLLDKRVIYKSGDIPEPNKEFESEMTTKEFLRLFSKILRGLVTRKLSWKNVNKLLKANSLAEKIKKHYESYPSDISLFSDWVSKANELWNQKKVATKEFSTFKIEYG
jgi:electron-transferring-flavoprotein dehydrogenase